MSSGAITFSDNDENYTPRWVIQNSCYDYDPATTKAQAEYLGIPNYDTKETDGLKTDWTQYRCIWINPPFTQKFEFLKKAVETVRQNNDCVVDILLPVSALTTKKFGEIINFCPFQIRFMSGRVKFEDADHHTKGSAPFGVCILHFCKSGIGRYFNFWTIVNDKKSVIKKSKEEKMN